ncbi:MAG: GNAT family N-acetyltransferase [Sphingomicrobium sp.]
MSDPRLDELAESARNRGLKLVRSRVRTPGKRRFGKVGLTDATGTAVFGMDTKGPTANPDDVEDYLRNLGAKDWGASLDVAVLPRKRKPRRAAANDAEPVREPRKAPAHPPPAPPAPPPPPPPPAKPKSPKIREAKPSDAARLAELIGTLEHDIDEKTVGKNLVRLKKAGELPLVATLDKQVVGFCGVHRMVAIHRPTPVGRIPILVIAAEARRRGIGRMLVEAAEKWCREAGCQMIEVTSNDRLTAAHAFYRHMGYERSSIRFFKKL